MACIRRGPPATYHRPPNAASVRGVLAAMVALHGPTEQRDPDANLAELEQRRREMEDRHRRQGELRLA